MNESKARDIRIWLLQALTLISDVPEPSDFALKDALERTKRAAVLLDEMIDESLNDPQAMFPLAGRR